jgi:hypothetical protein
MIEFKSKDKMRGILSLRQAQGQNDKFFCDE